MSVDDILVSGRDWSQLEHNTRATLQACKAGNIHLGKSKIQIGRSVEFGGLIIKEAQAFPHPEKTDTIKSWPTPASVSETRGFLGLTSQLAPWCLKLTNVLLPIRGLLKKDSTFLWLPEHQAAFEEAKRLLCSDLVISAFDPNKKSVVITDACVTGIGFVLLQDHPAMARIKGAAATPTTPGQDGAPGQYGPAAAPPSSSSSPALQPPSQTKGADPSISEELPTADRSKGVTR